MMLMSAVRLPFPLTIKFKSMLQAGVATKDMDPQWMSSISWYVLCIFGLQSVFNYLLGSDNGERSVSFTEKIINGFQLPVKWHNRWVRWVQELEHKCLVRVWIPTSSSRARPRI